jgi:hypothetical protein
MPYRAAEAARLFQVGKAPEVWVSRPENSAADLQKFGIRFVGEEEYNREILIYLGVPESSVHIFPDPIVNTEQEVNENHPGNAKAGKTKVTAESGHRPHRLRGPVRRRPLVAQHTRHVFRSPGNDGLGKRMDRTSRAAQLAMTASGIRRACLAQI